MLYTPETIDSTDRYSLIRYLGELAIIERTGEREQPLRWIVEPHSLLFDDEIEASWERLKGLRLEGEE